MGIYPKYGKNKTFLIYDYEESNSYSWRHILIGLFSVLFFLLSSSLGE